MKKNKRGQNEGSIYKHSTGKWCVTIPAAYSGTGKRRVIVWSKRLGQDAKNTREFMAGVLNRALNAEKGAVVAPRPGSVAAHLDWWLAFKEAEQEITPKTLEGYQYTVDFMITPQIGKKNLQSLTPEDVKQMMNQLRDDGRAPRSVAYARSILSMALNDGKREGKGLVRNVASEAKPHKRKKNKKQTLDLDSAKKLLVALEGDAAGPLITTVICCGLRIGEALGLRWRDVDLKGKSLHISQAYQKQGAGHVFTDVKTDNSNRSVRISDMLVTLLKSHKKQQAEQRMKVADQWTDTDTVFATANGTPIQPRNALRSLHRALDKAGLEKRSMHSLRHAAVTLMLAAGVPLDVVSDIVGHSSIRVTKDMYAGFLIERQSGAADAMGQLIPSSKKE